jgi:hypothetical protein
MSRNAKGPAANGAHAEIDNKSSENSYSTGIRTGKGQTTWLTGTAASQLESDTAAPIPEPKPAPVTVVDDSHEFDWSETESVVLREQPETAIYYNPSGDMVIRQRRWPDDDMLIIISEHSLMAFIDRLTDMAGIQSAGRQS